jgi:hypothetical protein
MRPARAFLALRQNTHGLVEISLTDAPLRAM